MGIVLEFLNIIITIASYLSWVIYVAIPFLLFYVGRSIFLYANQLKYKKAIDWQLLEIRIPRVITKGPKAMENFFNALYGLRNSPDKWSEIYLDGEVTRPFSLEIFAKKNSTRFFIRTPKGLKPAIISMIYAQYPDVQIADVDDYMNEFPETFEDLERLGYDMTASEMGLDKNPAYPISSYESFESKEGDVRIIDSMSLLLELLGRLNDNEYVGMQFIVAPENDDWKKESEKIVKEIKDKEQKASKESGQSARTPGEEAHLKSIERKRVKNGFKTLIRYFYVAPKSSFNKDYSGRALPTYFVQFANDSNKFKKNGDTAPSSDWRKYPYFLLHKKSIPQKKEFLWHWYRKRALPEKTDAGKLFNSTFLYLGGFKMKTIILNTEELATIFHLPTDVVLTAPVMKRVESKTLPPPPALPK